MSSFSLFDIAGMGMSAQHIRLNTVASNMANADTVGSSKQETYRAKHPVFSVVTLESQGISDLSGAGAGVKVDNIIESDKPLVMRYDPSHPKADENGYIYMPNVNIVQEMADMISASRSVQINVQMLNTAKDLMQQTLNLGR
jgi:flagellar basal-body rod protein FlgC